MKQIQGGVTAAKGFEAAGTAANIKYKDRMDMALIYSSAPCRVAVGWGMSTESDGPVRIVTSSWRITQSAPGGMGAPVMILTACPGSTFPLYQLPAYKISVTFNSMGSSSLAWATSWLRKA